MEEAVILKNIPSNVEDYQAQWQTMRSADAGLANIVEAVAKPEGTALIFSHDDPDGITSGLIFKRMLQKKGWKAELRMPAGFMLQPQQWEDALRDVPGVKAVFILDKGTLVPYSEFGKKLPVYIVDHHPTPKAPTDCVLFNPSLEKYTPCSTSLLAHGIATLSGTRDQFDDFLCLMGLKGDWAVEPVSGVLVDFAKPFFVTYGMAFKNMLTLLRERPTMFDASQREHTCLLSRITEFVHATGGGGFQYFYNDREPSLKTVDHPALIARALEAVAPQVGALTKISTLQSFVQMIPTEFKQPLDKIFRYFLQDWDSADKLLNSSVKALKLEHTGIYLFVGGKVPLLPMIGSIKLFDLKQMAGDKDAQIIMVSSVSPDYTHVSVRGTGDRVHSGKICGSLQDALQAKYAKYKDKISGGGHPRAAECTVRTTDVTFFNVLSQLMAHLNEMSEIDQKYTEGKPNKGLAKRAKELGLEYLAAAGN